MTDSGALREWIRKEMTIDSPDILDSMKEKVARLVGLSADGGVYLRVSRERAGQLTSRDKILLYMIGKLYAQAAGYSETDSATNSELVKNLGMPDGTVKSQVKTLRDSRYVTAVQEGNHTVVRSKIEEVIGEIEQKVGV